MNQYRVVFILSFLFIQWVGAVNFAYSQALSGTYTINSSGSGATNFTSFDAAITALNTNGVSGNVVFDVAAGQTFTRNGSSPILTATGTSSATITFQKSGTGANPVLTRSDAGSLVTSSIGGQGDAVLLIQGADYVTFTGIDITSTNAGIEYGVFFRKASATDGCQYSHFRNGVITMAGSGAYVVGIYVSNLDASSAVSSAVGVTVTSVSGRNEGIELTGNSIQNVQIGIFNYGFNHTSSPFDFQDQQIKIGGSAGNGNTIGKFRNTGVRLGYSNDVLITHNTIDYQAFGGTATSGDANGVWFSTGTDCSATVSNNTISVGMSTNNAMYGIRNATYKGNMTIENNTISLNATTVTTGRQEFISMFVAGTTTVLNVNNNQFGTSVVGNGNCFLMSFQVGIEANVNNNTVVGTITKNNSASGAFFGFSAGTVYGTNAVITISGNSITSVTGSSGSTAINGIVLDAAGSHTYRVFDNIIADLTGEGNVTGIYTDGTLDAYRNKIYNLKSNATASGSIVRGFHYFTGTTVNFYNNFIGNLIAPAITSTDAIRAIDLSNISAAGTVNLYHNTIYLNASSTGTDFGTSGVYIATSNSTTVNVADMRNNIIVNKSTAVGTGRSVALRRSGTLIANYSSSSDRNLFFASTLHSDGTNHHTTLSALKTALSPREANSYSEDVNFLSTTNGDANFLRVDPANAGVVKSGGVYLSSFAFDYDQQQRSTWGPDLGADEFVAFNLPVTLSAFSGKKKDRFNELNWSTATEINNAGFFVERSRNGVDFSSLGFVPTKATQGNSSITLSYSFLDDQPMAGLNYYRLRQEDRDGKQEFSKVLSVQHAVADWAVSIFPNPVKQMINIRLSATKTALLKAQLMDLRGVVVREIAIQSTTGETSHSFTVGDVQPGVYLLVITQADGSIIDMMRCVVTR